MKAFIQREIKDNLVNWLMDKLNKEIDNENTIFLIDNFAIVFIHTYWFKNLVEAVIKDVYYLGEGGSSIGI